jgi:hypothetical protein
MERDRNEHLVEAVRLMEEQLNEERANNNERKTT